MRTLLHFVRRDISDNAFSVSLLSLTLGYYFFRSQGMTNAELFLAVFPILTAVGCLVFFMFYQQSVWIGVRAWGRAVCRYYLLSLPFDRRQMFIITLLRGLLGAIPLMAFVFFYAPKMTRVAGEAVMAQFQTGTVIDLDWGALRRFQFFVGEVLTALFVQLQILNSGLFADLLRRVSGQGKRLQIFLINLIGVTIESAIASVLLKLGFDHRAEPWNFFAVTVAGAFLLGFRIWRLYLRWRFD